MGKEELASGAYLPQSGLCPDLPVLKVAGRGQLPWQTVLQARFWPAIARLPLQNVMDQLLLIVRLGCMHLQHWPATGTSQTAA